MVVMDPRWHDFAVQNRPDFNAFFQIRQALGEPPRNVSMLIDDAIRTAVNHSPGILRMRAFRREAFDYRVTSALVTSTMGSAETTCEWLARVTNDPEVCFAINGLSTWSVPLSRWSHGVVTHLLGGGGDEFPSRVDVYTFVANEGWTPFGIHRDTEPSLIFHLGPADKEVWVWPIGSLDPSRRFARNPSFGSPLSYDMDEHLHKAWHSVLKPGDFICIPKNVFHVFRNLGPSVFIGIAIYPANARKMLGASLTDALLGNISAGDDYSSEIQRLCDFLDEFESVEGVREAVHCEIDRARLRRSTAGYLDEINPAATHHAVDMIRRFRWEYSGVLAVYNRSDSTELVARGRSIRFKTRLDFSALLEMSLGDSVFTREELLNAMPPQLPDKDRRNIFERMYQYGAFSKS